MAFNPLEMIYEFIAGTISFFDGLYREGYMWYILIGLIVLFILILFFN